MDRGIASSHFTHDAAPKSNSYAYWSQAHWNAVHKRSKPNVRSKTAEAIRQSIASMATRLSAGQTFGRILDIAAGDGSLAYILGAFSSAEVIATDLSPVAMVSASRFRAQDHDPRFCVMNAASLALRSVSFDLVTCVRSLWCFRDPGPCLTEARRVLKSGGWILLQIWGTAENCRFMSLGATLLSRYIPELRRLPDTLGPFTFRPQTLEALLSNCGFADFVAERHDITPPCDDAAVYWQEFATVAETAHAALCSQSAADRATINHHCEALLGEARMRSVSLDLSWYVCAARASA
jgi:SAM-dependent methyltransferase